MDNKIKIFITDKHGRRDWASGGMRWFEENDITDINEMPNLGYDVEVWIGDKQVFQAKRLSNPKHPIPCPTTKEYAQKTANELNNSEHKGQFSYCVEKLGMDWVVAVYDENNKLYDYV